MREWLEAWNGTLDAILSGAPQENSALALAAISLLAFVIAVFGRHRGTIAITVFLVIVAFSVTRIGILASQLIAAAALVNATQGATRRALRMAVAAMDERLADIQASRDSFILALDRRTREVDARLLHGTVQGAETISNGDARAPALKPNGADHGTPLTE